MTSGGAARPPRKSIRRSANSRSPFTAKSALSLFSIALKARIKRDRNFRLIVLCFLITLFHEVKKARTKAGGRVVMILQRAVDVSLLDQGHALKELHYML